LLAGKEDNDVFGDDFQDLYFIFGAWVGVGEEITEEQLAIGFSLSSNYPNPFNPETRISYFIPKASRARLEIFDILGRKIRTLVAEDQPAGRKEVTWDGRNDRGEQVASGVYFYRLQAGDFSLTKKMVLMK
jgi:hypothetical protein